MEITKGKAELTGAISNPLIIADKLICTLNTGDIHEDKMKYVGEDEMRANAALITEAFNVANETGFSPRQLAEQNERYLEALKKIEPLLKMDVLTIGQEETNIGNASVIAANAINSTKI